MIIYSSNNIDQFFTEMQRCTKCLLPITYPGIVFDKEGLCNYCNSHQKITLLGDDKFFDILKRLKGRSEFDCIVPISGGRDSSYVLQQMVTKYKMNVLAVTVDHGFLLPEAYENISTITKNLNVKHEYIKYSEEKVNTLKNNVRIKFRGWVKNPSINTIIPVLNSGDKTMNLKMSQFAARQGIRAILGGNVIGTSAFEQDFFKLGYMGVFPDIYWRFTFGQKFKIFYKYLWEYLKNPYNYRFSIFSEYAKGYLIFFFEKLFRPKGIEYLGFWDYNYWEEEKILKIIREIGWKGADDTTTTWRIDDAAYPLINYLYLNIVGFTEHDEIYSKMIRENQITREEALKRCLNDHKPRFKIIQKDLIDYGIHKDDLDLSINHFRFGFLNKLLKKKNIKFIKE